MTSAGDASRQGKPGAAVPSENPSGSSPNHEQNALQRIHSGIDYADADSRHHLEADDNKSTSKPTPDSFTSSIDPSNQKIISWERNDPENPYNWSSAKKIYVVTVGGLSALNSTIGSSLPSNAVPFIASEFSVTSPTQLVLPISIYLLGYCFGPVLYGPLSETYGRKLIFFTTYFAFTLCTMGCALAPTWTAFVVFRMFCGVFGSAPIALVGGLYADIYNDPVTRGRAMAIFMAATGVGPLLSPIISGYISPQMGWRWTFWIGLIIAGASWPAMLFLPETYGPTLLSRRAAVLRKSTKDPMIFAPLELEKKNFKHIATVVLTRPIRMICFELIVSSTCAYLALAYAIFYMYFTAYPIVFQGIYGMSPGMSGLMFLPIAVGQFTGMIVFMAWDSYLARAKARGAAWANAEEVRRLPLACIGGPLYTLAIFWLGWSARENVHWIVPALSGVSSGIGFVLIYMALLNYLTDAYEIFAASAMAAASCCRSIAGTVLPLAAGPMYQRLGVPGASSLLGGLSLAMCVVPFLLLKWGDVIRSKSRFCLYLKEMKDREEEERRADEAIGNDDDKV